MQIIYSPKYEVDIGAHVFPTTKYRHIAERLVADRVVGPTDFIEPPPAAWDDLALVHTDAYLQRLRSGDFRLEELAQVELTWSQEIVDGFRLMTGGTLLAARLAVTPLAWGRAAPIVVHIGGGLHHGFPDHGEGFCFFNDVAVAIRALQRDHAADRVAVVDLDVHQGNGTAAIFAGDPSVFTLSIHQEHNYPVDKPASSLDVGLPDATGDDAYLEALDRHLPRAFADTPAVLFYLAGADPFEDDQLGGLALSKDGLRRRDHMVVTAARARGVPVVVCLAGGYARHLDDTVDIHYGTVVEAMALSAGSEDV